MLKKLLKKKGSAYLMAIGVLGVLTILGITISKVATSGRWNTVLTSNEKRAEECTEAASNLMFKVVKDRMNDDSVFYNSLPLPANPVDLMSSEYMYFRLPAFVFAAHMDALSGFQSKGMDVQLDILNNGLLKPIYEKGISYRYDSETDNQGPLSPLGDMFKSYGGKVSVRCTARIKQAFGILSDNPKYKTAGVELPVRKATGFLSGIFDKIMPEGLSSDFSKYLGSDKFSGKDCVKEEDGNFSIDISTFIPDQPNFFEKIECPQIWVQFSYGVVEISWIINAFLKKIFKGLQKSLGFEFTPKGIITAVLPKDILSIELPFGSIISRLKEAIKKCLPDYLSAFAGNINFGVTVEKKGFLEVETVLEFYPYAKNTSQVIRKKLYVQREFRVADIQPIAPDYTFFFANSALPYEEEHTENPDGWKGDDCINWNEGMGDLVLQNFPDFGDIKDFLNALVHVFSDFKGLVRNVRLPGQVRVNGTKEMKVKLGMFPSLTELGNKDKLKKIEILPLALGHKSGDKAACHDKDHDKHNIVPGFKSIILPPYFIFNDKAFDWGFMSLSDKVGGIGSYWVPVPPQYARTCFFGDFHISMPFSFRVEGYLKKVYSHIKLHCISIIIPPILAFPGFTITFPWLWCNNYAEPYGFCKWPPYDDDEKAKTSWKPDEPANLPANLYSTAQYLKKASYYYNSSQEFINDIDNRSIMDGKDKIFICDGVTFVNDSTLNLPGMKVRGRGIIVCAGNVSIDGDIERIKEYGDGNPTIFSIVARNGAIQIGYTTKRVDACLYGDRGIQSFPGNKLEINGNLCVNRLVRKDIKGDIYVKYKSRHTRSSLLSMIRPIAKYDPTRYHVTLSSKMAKFEFVKPQ